MNRAGSLLLPLILLMTCVVTAGAEEFHNSSSGITLSIPDTWEFVPVLAEDQPREVCAAQSKDGVNRFLSVIVLPSSGVEPQKELVAEWEQSIMAATGGTGDEAGIRILQGVPWYYVHITIPDVATMHIYSTFRNGMNYSISIVNPEIDDTVSLDEIDRIMASVQLTPPAAVAAIQSGFEHLGLDEKWGIALPQGFVLTDTVNSDQLAPWAYNLYFGLLSGGNADRVLVANDYFSQLLCMNLKTGMAPMDAQVATLVSKVSARKFEEEEGVTYEELSLGAWDRSPENVFLHRFRITRPNTRTTHYIFYLLRKDSTTMVKFQVPTSLESAFDAGIYKMMEASLNK